jgi:hypothetical protein
MTRWLAILLGCSLVLPIRAAEAVTLIPSLAPRQAHVVITSAGWTDRTDFLNHATTVARTWTNCPEWVPHSGAWRISACWAPEATFFEVNGTTVRISPVQWFAATSSAGLSFADIHVVVANDMAWAASTAQRLVLTRNPDTAILRHEMFHAWGGCADEYTASYNWADASNPRTPNLAASRFDAELKWGKLISARLVGEPYQDPAGWFRPTAEDCILRNPHKPSCIVCFRRQRDTFFNFIGQPVPPDVRPLDRPAVIVRIIE